MLARALRARPEKVATPLAAALVGFVSDTPPLVKLAVTVDVSVATTLPPESSTVTLGWVARAAPLASVVLGWVVTTSLVAVPVETVMFAEVAEKPSPVKVRV